MQDDEIKLKIVELTIEYMKNNNITHDDKFRNFGKIFVQFRIFALGY